MLYIVDLTQKINCIEFNIKSVQVLINHYHTFPLLGICKIYLSIMNIHFAGKNSNPCATNGYHRTQ